MDEILNMLKQAGKNITAHELRDLINEPKKKVLSPEQVKSAVKAKGLEGKVDVTDNGTLVGLLPLGFVKKAMEDGEDSSALYKPSAKDMEKIKAKSPLIGQYEVFVFEFQAADTDVDRGFEHFTEGALKEMADLAIKNKIPFLMTSENNMCGDHDWKAMNTKGKVFDAYVEERKGGGFNLIYKVYIPRIEKTKDILDGIFTGLYDKLSVGFSLSYEDFTCDLCPGNKSIADDECPHYPGGDYEGKTSTCTIRAVKDNFEISGVAVPMQPKAQVRLSASEVDSFTKSFNGSPEVDLSRFYKTESSPLSEVRKRLDEYNLLLSSVKSGTVDRIINDIDTIEDNSLMEPEATKAAEIKTPEVAETVLDQKDELVVTENCKSRVEDMITKAVTPLLAAIEAKSVDLSEVLNSIKSLKEEVLSELSALKAEIEDTKTAVKTTAVIAVPTVMKALEPEAQTKSEDEELMGMFGLSK